MEIPADPKTLGSSGGGFSTHYDTCSHGCAHQNNPPHQRLLKTFYKSGNIFFSRSYK